MDRATKSVRVMGGGGEISALRVSLDEATCSPLKCHIAADIDLYFTATSPNPAKT